MHIVGIIIHKRDIELIIIHIDHFNELVLYFYYDKRTFRPIDK